MASTKTVKPYVLFSRSAENNARMAQLASAHGLNAVCIDCFEVLRTDAAMPIGAFEFTVFTSAAAVNVLKDVEHNRLHSLPAFAVGDRTAEALRSKAYRNVHSAAGDVEALRRQLIAFQKDNGALNGLYVRSAVVSGDLANQLLEYGLKITDWPIYRVTEKPVAHDTLAQALDAVAHGIVAVFSAESGRRLMKLVSDYGLTDRFSTMTLAGISESAVSKAKPECFASTLIAPQPNAESLLATLADHIQR